ncbi:MAG: CapA family protein [Clostridia bacterium]|nr:CapA family protein [Clostridia bacterium]
MKILFASDMSFNYIEQLPTVEKAKTAMSEAAAEFKKADFTMLNLENIFGDRETGTPIVKSGPNLISSDEFIHFVDALSPTAVGLANNHTGDFQGEPMFHTVRMLHDRGYQTTGAGKDVDEAYIPVKFTKDGITVSVQAVCENEFGTATDTACGSAGYSLGRVTKFIQNALKKGEKPIVYFHGGNEECAFPSMGKTELYRHFIDIGASAVIAMHTHCPQGYEIYNGAPIVYSMGNFFFPHAKPKAITWYIGYMSVLDVSNDGVKLSTVPYRFDKDGIKLLTGEALENFESYICNLNSIIADDRRHKEMWDAWCARWGMGNYIKHVVNDVAELDDLKRVVKLKNIFSCEAHNELITDTLRLLYDGKLEQAKEFIDYTKQLQNPEI